MKHNIKAIILTYSLYVDLWELNKTEIKLSLFMCMHCPPSAGPLEVSGPHFGHHCPKRLIKLLYSRVPYGHRDHRKHLLWSSEALRPWSGTPSSFYGDWLLTQSPLSDCASLFTRGSSRVSARQSGSKRTSRDDKFRKFSLFLKKKVTELVNRLQMAGQQVLIVLFKPTQTSYYRPNRHICSNNII